MLWLTIIIVTVLQVELVQSVTLTRSKGKRFFSRVPPFFSSLLVDDEHCQQQEKAFRKLTGKLELMEKDLTAILVILETLHNKIQLTDDLLAIPPHSSILPSNGLVPPDDTWGSNIAAQSTIQKAVAPEVQQHPPDKPLEQIGTEKIGLVSPKFNKSLSNNTPKHDQDVPRPIEVHIPSFLDSLSLEPPMKIAVDIRNGSQVILHKMVVAFPDMTAKDALFELAAVDDSGQPPCHMVYNKVKRCVMIDACIDHQSRDGYKWITSVYDFHDKKLYSGDCLPWEGEVRLYPGYKIRITYAYSVHEQ